MLKSAISLPKKKKWICAKYHLLCLLPVKGINIKYDIFAKKHGIIGVLYNV